MNRVLIVDDSRSALFMTAAQIQKRFPEAAILKAEDGQKAVVLMQEEASVDLALIDYNMPGINGVECAIQLRELAAAENYILCTANIQHAIKERAKENGMSMIGKPFNIPKLLAAVAELAESDR